jgi:hypothetical protein
MGTRREESEWAAQAAAPRARREESELAARAAAPRTRREELELAARAAACTRQVVSAQAVLPQEEGPVRRVARQGPAATPTAPTA